MSEPDIYTVDAHGNRVADDDVKGAFIVNSADPTTPGFLEGLKDGSSTLSESAQSIKDPGNTQDAPKSDTPDAAAAGEGDKAGAVAEPKQDKAPEPVSRKVR